MKKAPRKKLNGTGAEISARDKHYSKPISHDVNTIKEKISPLEFYQRELPTIEEQTTKSNWPSISGNTAVQPE